MNSGLKQSQLTTHTGTGSKLCASLASYYFSFGTKVLDCCWRMLLSCHPGLSSKQGGWKILQTQTARYIIIHFFSVFAGRSTKAPYNRVYTRLFDATECFDLFSE